MIRRSSLRDVTQPSNFYTGVAAVEGGCITASADGTVQRWGNDKDKLAPKATRSDVRGQCIWARGVTCLVGNREGRVWAWDTASDKACTIPDALKQKGPVNAVTQVGSSIAAASSDGTIHFYSLPDPIVNGYFPEQEIRTATFRLAQERVPSVIALAWVTSNNNVISGHADGTVALWELGAGSALAVQKWQDPGGQVSAVECAEHLVCSGGRDYNIRLRDSRASSDKAVNVLSGHTAGVNALVWDRERQSLFSGSDDGTIRRWTHGRFEGEIVATHDQEVYSLALTQDWENKLLSGSVGEVASWDPSSWESRIAASTVSQP